MEGLSLLKVCDCSCNGYEFHDLDSLLESLGLLSQNKSVIRSPILSVSKGQSTATYLRTTGRGVNNNTTKVYNTFFLHDIMDSVP